MAKTTPTQNKGGSCSKPSTCLFNKARLCRRRSAIGRIATSSTAHTSRPAATVCFNLVRTLPNSLKI